MKYMMMMNAPGKTPYQIFTWPKADIEAHIAFMWGFAKKLSDNGARNCSGPRSPGARPTVAAQHGLLR